MNEVIREDHLGVATLILNRPDKRNALTTTMFSELRHHLDDIRGDKSVRCLILEGRGRSFCAGRDLQSVGDTQRAQGEYFEAETIDLLEEIPQPSICKVHGHCYTGGLELALACDFIICGESARFSDTHAELGLTPIWGMTIRMVEHVGRPVARELMFSGRVVDGQEAAIIGIANRCVEDVDLKGIVDEIAQQIVSNSYDSHRINKSIMSAQAGLSRKDALSLERSRPYGRAEDRDIRASAKRASQRPSI